MSFVTYVVGLLGVQDVSVLTNFYTAIISLHSDKTTELTFYQSHVLYALQVLYLTYQIWKKSVQKSPKMYDHKHCSISFFVAAAPSHKFVKDNILYLICTEFWREIVVWPIVW